MLVLSSLVYADLDLDLGAAITVDESVFVFQRGNTCGFLSSALDVGPEHLGFIF